MDSGDSTDWPPSAHGVDGRRPMRRGRNPCSSARLAPSVWPSARDAAPCACAAARACATAAPEPVSSSYALVVYPQAVAAQQQPVPHSQRGLVRRAAPAVRCRATERRRPKGPNANDTEGCQEPSGQLTTARGPQALFRSATDSSSLSRRQVHHILRQVGVLVFELSQPTQFTEAQASVLLLSNAERRLAHPDLTAHVTDRRRRLDLAQHAGDLFFVELRGLHRSPPSGLETTKGPIYSSLELPSFSGETSAA